MYRVTLSVFFVSLLFVSVALADEVCKKFQLGNRTWYVEVEGRLYPIKEDSLGLKRRVPLKSVTPGRGCFDSQPNKVRYNHDGSLPKGFVEITELFLNEDLQRGSPRDGAVYNLGIDWSGVKDDRKVDSFFFKITVIEKEEFKQCCSALVDKNEDCAGIKIKMILSDKAAQYVRKAKERGAKLFLS